MTTLTTSTEAGTDAVDAFLAGDLVDDDLAALENAGLNVRRIIEDDAGVVARNGGYGRDGERLAIDDDGLTLPVRHISALFPLGIT